MRRKRSKAWACRRSLSRIVGFYRTGDINICLLWVLYVVSASGWSLVQRSPNECGVSECDREASIMRRLWPSRSCSAIGGGGGRERRNIHRKMCKGRCQEFISCPVRRRRNVHEKNILRIVTTFTCPRGYIHVLNMWLRLSVLSYCSTAILTPCHK
jgi:hypothetical protein